MAHYYANVQYYTRITHHEIIKSEKQNTSMKKSILRDYHLTFCISALVSARDSYINPDSEAGGLMWVEG